MEPKNLSPPAAPAVQSQAPLLTCGSCWTSAHGINSSSYSWQPFSHPHTQWFISQLELTVSSQEYLKELRILLFQRALYKLPSRDVLKKGNYYFFLYNNYICFKSLYAHDKVVCFSVGFSYSVLMWPRFAVQARIFSDKICTMKIPRHVEGRMTFLWEGAGPVVAS